MVVVLVDMDIVGMDGVCAGEPGLGSRQSAEDAYASHGIVIPFML